MCLEKINVNFWLLSCYEQGVHTSFGGYSVWPCRSYEKMIVYLKIQSGSPLRISLTFDISHVYVNLLGRSYWSSFLYGVNPAV